MYYRLLNHSGQLVKIDESIKYMSRDIHFIELVSLDINGLWWFGMVDAYKKKIFL